MVTGQTHDVFFCYSWKNQESALALHATLMALGLRVYLGWLHARVWGEPGGT